MSDQADCGVCGGDCGGANPPALACPMRTGGGAAIEHKMTPEALPICLVCGEEIEPDDCTEEGGTLYHFVCCPPDEETLADE